MSGLYHLRIIVPVLIKNLTYLCKQATGQIGRAMIAFTGCRFVCHHLFGEIPGELLGKKVCFKKVSSAVPQSSSTQSFHKRDSSVRPLNFLTAPFVGGLVESQRGPAFFLAYDCFSPFAVALTRYLRLSGL